MKFLSLPLMLFACTALFADSSFEKDEATYTQPSDASQLFAFYSQEAAKLAPDELEQNLEILARKDIVWFSLIGEIDSFEKIISELLDLQKELKTTLSLATPDSNIFHAIELRSIFIEEILSSDPKTMEDVGAVASQFMENRLRKWASSPCVEAKELRLEVLKNIKNDPEIAAAFQTMLLSMQDDPELALQSIKPTSFEVLGIEETEEGECYLIVALQYNPSPLCEIRVEMGL